MLDRPTVVDADVLYRKLDFLPWSLVSSPPSRPIREDADELRSLVSELAGSCNGWEHTFGMANVVMNRAALTAYAHGDPARAERMCQRQIVALIDGQISADKARARAALQPYVNVARLRVGAGDPGSAHRMYRNLWEAAEPVEGRGNCSYVRYADLDIPVERADERGVEFAREVYYTEGVRCLAMAEDWEGVLRLPAHNGDVLWSTINQARWLGSLRIRNLDFQRLLEPWNAAIDAGGWYRVLGDLVKSFALREKVASTALRAALRCQDDAWTLRSRWVLSERVLCEVGDAEASEIAAAFLDEAVSAREVRVARRIMSKFGGMCRDAGRDDSVNGLMRDEHVSAAVRGAILDEVEVLHGKAASMVRTVEHY